MEIHDGEAFLLRCHISPYLEASIFNHEPERKRKIIGEEFIRVFEEESHRIGKAAFLVQGTLYSDVIESGTRSAAKIAWMAPERAADLVTYAHDAALLRAVAEPG